ncbi:uncharacterized protein BJ212DRAFT_1484686 [Suillus subaureus]|uniref:Uncharacterized protein n=1 Tax=Suillus subaureus TaxID=48587 RepID=A0A9P7J961_9AGAM|nr:uncharacterized protein BJ212DRAFT_1484686 [Suillus subaureus]KAG1809180.1 hypothetical protein BJ212DRAFT_1484686 [Suillus subaureus]
MHVAQLYSLGWVVPKVKAAGFKVKNINVLGTALFLQHSGASRCDFSCLLSLATLQDIVDATPRLTLVQHPTAHICHVQLDRHSLPPGLMPMVH